MTFYLKFEKLYYSLLWKHVLLPAIWVLICCDNIIRGRSIGFYYSVLCFFAFFLLLGAMKTALLLYRIILKKPALTVNEIYIYDHYKKIKYLWDDIEGAVSSKDDLQIKPHDPVKYVECITNPLKRLWVRLLYKLFKRKPAYYIGFLDFLDTNNEPILKILSGYSIASET